MVVISRTDLFVYTRLGVDMLFMQHLRAIELTKYTHHTSSIYVICHSTTIIDMTCCVSQYLHSERRRLSICFQKLKVTTDWVEAPYHGNFPIHFQI